MALSKLNVLAAGEFPQVFEGTSPDSPNKTAFCFPSKLHRSTLFDGFGAAEINETITYFGLNEIGDSQTVPFTMNNLEIPVSSKDGVKMRANIFFFLLMSLEIGLTITAGEKRDYLVDFVIRCNGNKVLMQVECPWELRIGNTSADAKDLLHIYDTHVGNKPKWMHAVARCVSYMIDNKCRFCILSTLTYFHVIHLSEQQGTQVYISDRISTVTKSSQDNVPIPLISTTQAAIRQQLMHFSDPAINLECNESEMVYKMAFLFAIMRGMQTKDFKGPGPMMFYIDRSSRKGLGRGKGRVTKARRLTDNSDLCVLSPMDNLTYLGEGSFGIVFQSQKGDVPIVYKIINPLKRDEAVLMREKMMYKRFESLQGLYLPKILVYNVCTAGGMPGFGMELLQPLPSQFALWTDVEVREVKTLLISLADNGLYQLDIQATNFGRNDQGNVVMFDLEDVCCAEDVEDVVSFKIKYVTELDDVLAGNCG